MYSAGGESVRCEHGEVPAIQIRHSITSRSLPTPLSRHFPPRLVLFGFELHRMGPYKIYFFVWLLSLELWRCSQAEVVAEVPSLGFWMTKAPSSAGTTAPSPLLDPLWFLGWGSDRGAGNGPGHFCCTHTGLLVVGGTYVQPYRCFGISVYTTPCSSSQAGL